jgi:hypothetical protein
MKSPKAAAEVAEADGNAGKWECWEGRGRVATPSQRRADTPSPSVALLMTRDVLNQDGMDANNASKTAQSTVGSETGMAMTKEKRPNGAGKLLMETKRDHSQLVWAG